MATVRRLVAIALLALVTANLAARVAPPSHPGVTFRMAGATHPIEPDNHGLNG